MASETHKEKGEENPMTSLKSDSASKASNNDMTGPKDGSTSDAISCISSADGASSIKESEVDQVPLLAEHNKYHMDGLYSYYYPDFSGSFGEGEDQAFFGGAEELDVHCSANQDNSGPVLYYYPCYPPGFAHYGPFLPRMTGHYGEYIGQHMVVPSTMFHQPLISSGFIPQPVFYSPEMVPSLSWDSSAFFADGVHGNGFGGDTALPCSRNNLSSQNRLQASSKSLHASQSASLEKKSTVPAELNMLPNPAVRNQNLMPVTKATAHVSKVILALNKYSSNSDPDKGRLAYSNYPSNINQTEKIYTASEKLKVKKKTPDSTDFDMLTNQKDCPPAACLGSPGSAAVSSVQLQDSAIGNKSNCAPDIKVKKDEHNSPEFPTTYDHALFFVIKSYSEDDIHKSIKYNVWSSTPNGNRRLDSAFQTAQEKSSEKGCHCPVFLFFSVNASGQFCGLAEMIGRVDFNKSMDFWQQDKWTGYFPVKWHIIKDVPNPQFRHVTLENNDNKPVTNSRDTQEVKFPQGTEILSIFRNYRCRTSILDDFAFYDNRQRALQDKKGKTSASKLGHLKVKGSEVTGVAKLGDQQPTDLGGAKAQENVSAD